MLSGLLSRDRNITSFASPIPIKDLHILIHGYSARLESLIKPWAGLRPEGDTSASPHRKQGKQQSIDGRITKVLLYGELATGKGVYKRDMKAMGTDIKRRQDVANDGLRWRFDVHNTVTLGKSVFTRNRDCHSPVGLYSYNRRCAAMRISGITFGAHIHGLSKPRDATYIMIKFRRLHSELIAYEKYPVIEAKMHQVRKSLAS